MARISPYKFSVTKGIGGQCCEDDFYENNEGLNKLLWKSENDMAPLLVKVCKKEDFDTQEAVAIRLLAVGLYLRTRKAVERAKVFPKFIAKEVIEHGVKRGELPLPPEGKVTENLFDFTHVAGTYFRNTHPWRAYGKDCGMFSTELSSLRKNLTK